MAGAATHPAIPSRSLGDEVRLFDPTSSILDFNTSMNDWNWTGDGDEKQQQQHQRQNTIHEEEEGPTTSPEEKQDEVVNNDNTGSARQQDEVGESSSDNNNNAETSSLPPLDQMTVTSYESMESDTYQPLKPPAPSRSDAANNNSTPLESSESTDEAYNNSALMSLSTGKNSTLVSSLSSFSPISKASKAKAPSAQEGFFKNGANEIISTDEALKALDKRFNTATAMANQVAVNGKGGAKVYMPPVDIEETTQVTFVSGVTLPAELDYDLVRNPFDQMRSSARRVDASMPSAPSRSLNDSMEELHVSNETSTATGSNTDSTPKLPGRSRSNDFSLMEEVVEEPTSPENSNNNPVKESSTKEATDMDNAKTRRRERSRSRGRPSRKSSSAKSENFEDGGHRRSSLRPNSRSQSESALEGAGAEGEVIEAGSGHRHHHRRRRSTSRGKTRSSSTGRTGSGEREGEDKDSSAEERRRRRRERSASRSRASRQASTTSMRSASENVETDQNQVSTSEQADGKEEGTSEGHSPRRRRRSRSGTRRSSRDVTSGGDGLGQSSHSTGSRRRRRSKSRRTSSDESAGEDALLSPTPGEESSKELRRRKRSSSKTKSSSRERTKSSSERLSSSSEHLGETSHTQQSVQDDDAKASRGSRRSSSRDRRRRSMSSSGPSKDSGNEEGNDKSDTFTSPNGKSRSSRRLLDVANEDVGSKKQRSSRKLDADGDEANGTMSPLKSSRHRSSRKLDNTASDGGEGEIATPRRSGKQRSSRKLASKADDDDSTSVRPKSKSPRPGGKQRSSRRMDIPENEGDALMSSKKSPKPRSRRKLDINSETGSEVDGDFLSPRKTPKQKSARKLNNKKEGEDSADGNLTPPRDTSKQRSSRKLMSPSADEAKGNEMLKTPKTPKTPGRSKPSSSRRLNASSHSSTPRSAKPKSSRSLGSSKHSTKSQPPTSSKSLSFELADVVDSSILSPSESKPKSWKSTSSSSKKSGTKRSDKVSPLSPSGRLRPKSAKSLSFRKNREHNDVAEILSPSGRTPPRISKSLSYHKKKGIKELEEADEIEDDESFLVSPMESIPSKSLGSFMQSGKPRSSKSVGNISSTPTSPTVVDEEQSTPTTPGYQHQHEPNSTETSSITQTQEADSQLTGNSRWVALKGGINFINNTKKQLNVAAKTPTSRKDVLAASKKQAEGDRIASIVTHAATDMGVEEAPTSLRLASAAVDKMTPKKNSKWNKIKTSMNFVSELKRQADESRGHVHRHVDLREEEDDATIESQLSPRQKRITSMINRLDGVKPASLSRIPMRKPEVDKNEENNSPVNNLQTPRSLRKIKFIPKSEMDRMRASEAAPSEVLTTDTLPSTSRFTPKDEIEHLKETRQGKSKWSAIRGGMQFINSTKKRAETRTRDRLPNKSSQAIINDVEEGEIEFFDPKENPVQAKASAKESPLFYDYDKPPEASDHIDEEEEIISLKSPSPQQRRSQRKIRYEKAKGAGGNGDAASAAPSMPSLCDYSTGSKEKSPTSMKWKKLKTGMDFLRETKRKANRRKRKGKQ